MPQFILYIFEKGTIDIRLRYPKNITFDLLGDSDADFADCITERKSTSDTCYFIETSNVLL